MKNTKVILLIILATTLAACGNESDQATIETEEQAQNERSSEDMYDESLEADSPEDTSNTDTENIDQNHVPNEKEATSNPPSEIETSTDSNPSLKSEYLKKLNKMEEEDRHADVGTTIPELEEQETARFHKWDKELNEIYGLLEEQLSNEQMEQLRVEQRDWITYRDEEAKKASLKYEGGSTETLEYIATRASLTRERCYVLVAQYME